MTGSDPVRPVLLLGGYGGFGGRIAPRLVEAGFEVLIAGRSLAKAEAFCAGRPGFLPVALDRDRGLVEALAVHRPFALVDAAGPFQGASYGVARACIAAGVPYLDISDGRDFVAGIGMLDADARAAGVPVLSGASSVPALSGAVVRMLAAGMEDVRAVEMGIGASNRAAAGASVTRAILSYVGRPIPLWRAGRWTARPGWSELRPQGFRIAGMAPIRPRFAGIVDVPDLTLLPERLPGRPAVTFRAGTEFAIPNLALWCLSWPVRSGLLRSLEILTPPLVWVQRVTARWGSGRSGMVVRVFGTADGRRLERRWTLIAEKGDGPEIPGLAVPILLRRIQDGAIPPGARDTGEILSLEDFAPAFGRLAVQHETIALPQPKPLYGRLMGARFDDLPPTIRAMHDVLRDKGASGQAVVTRGAGFGARLVAALFGFPPAGRHDLHVAFAERDGVETWTRDFGGRRFRSHLSARDGRLVERFGPLRFAFDLPGGPDGLRMDLKGWWIGPVPMPLAWGPRSEARETEADGRFRFDVPIALPLIGEIVRYRGWLVPTDAAPPSADRLP